MDAKVNEPEATLPPPTNAEGFALHGDYPLNHRLRAEALADADETTDPDGMITDDLIASTKERLRVERAEERSNTPSLNWTRDDLVEHATGLKIELPAKATKEVILDAINAAPPASQEG